MVLESTLIYIGNHVLLCIKNTLGMAYSCCGFYDLGTPIVGWKINHFCVWMILKNCRVGKPPHISSLRQIMT